MNRLGEVIQNSYSQFFILLIASIQSLRSKEDFESLAMLVDGVNKAKADYECGRKLTVYISPDGGAVASSELINNYCLSFEILVLHVSTGGS